MFGKKSSMKIVFSKKEKQQSPIFHFYIVSNKDLCFWIELNLTKLNDI